MDHQVWVLRAPRISANDDTVTLARWLVADGALVRAGDAVAEIETEKATMELPAGAAGLLVQALAAGAEIAVGGTLAYIGHDAASIAAARPAVAAAVNTSAWLRATAKARALAARSGIDLAAVPASGETVKQSDVERYLAGTDAAVDAAVIVEPLSPHRARLGRNLREARDAGLFTTLTATLDLTGAKATISAELAQGRAVSLLGVLLHALGRTLPQFPALTAVVRDGRMLRRRDIDIAFAARSLEGELFAPVIRRVDTLSLADVGRECARLTKAAMRGRLAAADADGAGFAVSVIALPLVDSFVALPAPLQGAILSLGAERQQLELTEGKPRRAPGRLGHRHL